MPQYKITLEPALRAKLDAAAEVSDTTLADEIRRRLERTFEEDRADLSSRELSADVVWIADEVNRQCGQLSWHTSWKVHEALTVALQTWLEIIKPAADVSPAVSDLLGPYDPPTLGRSIARHYQRFKAEMAKTHAEIVNRYKEGKS